MPAGIIGLPCGPAPRTRSAVRAWCCCGRSPTASALATALNAALPRAPVRAGGTGARRWFSRPAQSCSVRRTSRRPSTPVPLAGSVQPAGLKEHFAPCSGGDRRPPSRARIERARAAIRRVVWTLLTLRLGGSSWISVCGRELANWYVLDLDATVVTCTSRREDAAGTFKGSFGHMPLSAWWPTPVSASPCRCGRAPPRPTTLPTTRRSRPRRFGGSGRRCGRSCWYGSGRRGLQATPCSLIGEPTKCGTPGGDGMHGSGVAGRDSCHQALPVACTSALR